MNSVKRIWDRTIGAVLVAGALGLIRGYQMTLSPMLGNVCRYYPSCSRYGYQAIKVHRFGKGVILTALRIARCHPWAQGGLDPVPPVGLWRVTPESHSIEHSTTSGVSQAQR